MAIATQARTPEVIPPFFVSYNLVHKYLNNEINDHEFSTLIQNNLHKLSGAYIDRGIANTGYFRISGSLNPTPLHVDINLVNGLELDIEKFRKWQPQFANAQFLTEEDDKYICGSAIEKMSKSYFNVVNPDQIISDYGADTLRMYEMFLGPLEASKPRAHKALMACLNS